MTTSGAEAELTRRDGVIVLRLSGELDVMGIDDVRGVVDEAVRGEDPLVVDLGSVSYLDSGGVRLLLETRKRLGGDRAMVVVVPKGSFVRKVLDLVDIAAVVPVHETVAGAVAVVGAQPA